MKSSTPTLAGSLGIGGDPSSVFVSGRYAYVTDRASNDLKVIDVSDPTSPSLAGSLGVGADPTAVYVSGRYAYVVDTVSDDLKVIDVSGAELGSALVDSLEAGSLQVRESLMAQGQLQVTGGVNVSAGGLFSDGDVGIDGDVAITGDLTADEITTDQLSAATGTLSLDGNLDLGTFKLVVALQDAPR